MSFEPMKPEAIKAVLETASDKKVASYWLKNERYRSLHSVYGVRYYTLFGDGETRSELSDTRREDANLAIVHLSPEGETTYTDEELDAVID